MSETAPQAAIIGAGPAGLVLACPLQAQGCRTLVIEARRDGSTASRATGLRHGTLKLLERQQTQRVAHDDRHPCVLRVTESTQQDRVADEAQVRLRLPATGREPEQVGKVALR